MKVSLLTAAGLMVASPAAAEKVVVTADRMLDVQSGRMIDYPAVFIGDDGRITAVADARTVRWGSDVRHIDLSGRTLLPGFIDMHVHLSSDPGGEFWREAQQHPDAAVTAAEAAGEGDEAADKPRRRRRRRRTTGGAGE